MMRSISTMQRRLGVDAYSSKSRNGNLVPSILPFQLFYRILHHSLHCVCEHSKQRGYTGADPEKIQQPLMDREEIDGVIKLNILKYVIVKHLKNLQKQRNIILSIYN